MREGRNAATKSAEDPERLAALQSDLLHAGNVSGIFYPLDEETSAFPVNPAPDVHNLAVPPPTLWHGYGSTEDDYLTHGRYNARVFYDAYQKHSPPLSAGQRVLDFGCSAGRMVRHFADQAVEGVEVWGCDIDAAAIEWCQKNLMPPLQFFINTTQPHLPFPDKHFDFIYAGSVFSHMNELTAAWLLELARITKPGGIGIYSIHSELTLDYQKADMDRYGKQVRYLGGLGLSRETLIERGRQNFLTSPWWVSAWYSVDYFTRLATLGYEVVEVAPGLYGYQTGIILRGR